MVVSSSIGTQMCPAAPEMLPLAARARGPDLMERQDEVICAHVHLAAVEGTEPRVPVAVVGHVQLEGRRLAAHERVHRLEAGARRVGGQHAVQDGDVRGVDAALEALQPVALLDDLGDVAVRGRRLRPREVRQRRPVLRRSEVGPDDAARLRRRVGRGADLVREAQLLRLVHHVHAAAVDVELPAVVDAAQAAVLVAAEEERHEPVRAVLVEEPDAAARVAEGDQLLAEQLDAHRRAVGPGQLPREERGDPVAPQRLAHRGAAADARHSLVVFACHHRVVLPAVTGP